MLILPLQVKFTDLSGSFIISSVRWMHWWDFLTLENGASLRLYLWQVSLQDFIWRCERQHSPDFFFLNRFSKDKFPWGEAGRLLSASGVTAWLLHTPFYSFVLWVSVSVRSTLLFHFLHSDDFICLKCPLLFKSTSLVSPPVFPTSFPLFLFFFSLVLAPGGWGGGRWGQADLTSYHSSSLFKGFMSC